MLKEKAVCGGTVRRRLPGITNIGGCSENRINLSCRTEILPNLSNSTPKGRTRVYP